MKKMAVVMILMMVVVIATVVFTTNVKAGTDVDVYETLENNGVVCNVDPGQVSNWLDEWVSSAGDGRAYQELENGYYRGYGVVEGKEFEKEYDMLPTFENIAKIYDEVIGGEYNGQVIVTTAGFYTNDDGKEYTVYQVTVVGSEKPIGEYYDSEEEEWIEYYNGDMYFMVQY